MMHTSADSLLSSLSLRPSQSTSAWFACSDIPALKTSIELTTSNYMKPSLASTVSMIVYRCIHNECCGTISFEIYTSSHPYDVMVMLNYDHPVQHHDDPRPTIQPVPTASAPVQEAQIVPKTSTPVEIKINEVEPAVIPPQTAQGDNSTPTIGIKLCTRCQRFEVSITHKTCVRGTGCRINERRRLPPRPSKKAGAIEAEPDFATDDADLPALPPPTPSASLSPTKPWPQVPTQAGLDATAPQHKDYPSSSPRDDAMDTSPISRVVQAGSGANALPTRSGQVPQMLETTSLHSAIQVNTVGTISIGETRPLLALTQPPSFQNTGTPSPELANFSPSFCSSESDFINEYLANDVPGFSSSPLTSASSSPATTPPPEISLTQMIPEVWDPSQDNDLNLSGMRTCGGTKCSTQVPANGRFKKCDDCREKFRIYQIARRQKQKKPSQRPKQPKVNSVVSIQPGASLDVSSDTFLQVIEFDQPELGSKRKFSDFADAMDSDDEYEQHAHHRVRLVGQYDSADEYENDEEWQE